VASKSSQESVGILEDCLDSDLIKFKGLHDGVGLRMMFWYDKWLLCQGFFASCILEIH